MRGASTRGARPADATDGPADATAPPATGGGAPFADASREARKLAAAILEVLAGASAPTDAARAVGVSLARYYQLETRAMAGLVAACEDRRRRGRGNAPGSELVALRREVVQLRRECARQQALVRASRRAVGLASAPQPPPEQPAPKRRGRRPTARALRMAALLQQGVEPAESSPAAPAASEAAVAEAAAPQA